MYSIHYLLQNWQNNRKYYWWYYHTCTSLLNLFLQLLCVLCAESQTSNSSRYFCRTYLSSNYQIIKFLENIQHKNSVYIITLHFSYNRNLFNAVLFMQKFFQVSNSHCWLLTLLIFEEKTDNKTHINQETTTTFVKKKFGNTLLFLKL